MNTRPEEAEPIPDWRGFDEQVIPDGLWHYQNNEYAKSWNAFRTSRSMTGLVNTWIWRSVGFKRSYWVTVSLGLHVTNAVLLFLLFSGMRGFMASSALIATMVFFLHPIQTSAVLQVGPRSTLQSATFAFAAMLCLSLGFWPVALLSQFLSVKSKEDGWMYMAFWPMVWYFR